MKFQVLSAALALASTVLAQRPTNESICDYYTTALLMNNTAANQYTLLTLIVNTVVIGNYTQPNVGIAVPGILAPGTYMNQSVNLAPYFTGELASTNRNGTSGVSVNFLDGGGAAPLLKNMPANDKTSNQYFLLTHLYEFFGALLGCSTYGNSTDFPAYSGDQSMFQVHKYMVLDQYENGYFIEQVAMAAASFGVAADDLAVVGSALATYFNVRCSPPAEIIPGTGTHLQEICAGIPCPYGASGDTYCSAYPSPVPSPSSAVASGAAATTSAAASAASSAAASASAKPVLSSAASVVAPAASAASSAASM